MEMINWFILEEDKESVKWRLRARVSPCFYTPPLFFLLHETRSGVFDVFESPLNPPPTPALAVGGYFMPVSPNEF